MTPKYNPYTAMDRQDISRPGARESLRNAIETLIQARIASKQQINGNMAIHFIDQAIDQIRGNSMQHISKVTIELIRGALSDWKAGKLSELSCLYAIHVMVNNKEPNDAIKAWMESTIKRQYGVPCPKQK